MAAAPNSHERTDRDTTPALPALTPGELRQTMTAIPPRVFLLSSCVYHQFKAAI
jgi:hypothetical protein